MKELKGGKMKKTLNLKNGKSKSYPKNDLVDNYERLKTLRRFEKKKIKKDMHRAMSRISAISGYLELMKIVLWNDVDMERIKRYRTIIDEGIYDLGNIIENLHEVFDEESGFEESESDKNLNGLEI